MQKYSRRLHSLESMKNYKASRFGGKMRKSESSVVADEKSWIGSFKTLKRTKRSTIKNAESYVLKSDQDRLVYHKLVTGRGGPKLEFSCPARDFDKFDFPES